MATLVVVGDAVDVDVDGYGYGSTHDDELVVPSGMMMNHPSNPSWKTKKAVVVLLSILGLTAVVASGGASMVFPSIVNSLEQARTEESFLLHDGGGGGRSVYDCVVASGSWPQVNGDLDKGGGSSQPFVSCFSTWHEKNQQYLQCWSRSHYAGTDNDWDWDEACEPEGYGSVWEYADPNGWNNEGETTSCGRPCTAFNQYD